MRHRPLGPRDPESDHQPSRRLLLLPPVCPPATTLARAYSRVPAT